MEMFHKIRQRVTTQCGLLITKEKNGKLCETYLVEKKIIANLIPQVLVHVLCSRVFVKSNIVIIHVQYRNSSWDRICLLLK